MALPSASFVAGIIVLAYLASFVLFAFIRIATGISIQRIGYSGLRRIAYTPREGIKIELRGLGFSLHRPTFAQPTWISVVLTELKVTLDLRLLATKNKKRSGWVNWPHGAPGTPTLTSAPSLPGGESDAADHGDAERSRTWEKLTELKEKIKRLHRKIQWIRLVDVIATTSTVAVVDVGSVQVSNFTMAVDTRRKTVDRSRLFRHLRQKKDERRPAEWIFTVRGILFTPDTVPDNTPDDHKSVEILDNCTLNINGLLYKELDGLRDASISLKLGRLIIPYDEIQIAVDKSKRRKAMHRRRGTGASEPDVSFADIAEELEHSHESQEESIVRTVSDSKDFVASILRGIQEIQFAVSSIGLTKRIRTGSKGRPPVWFNFQMKEVGLDLERLDPRSPAHLQYFSPGDVAHQALFSAISLSAGLDTEHGTPERLLYIPMLTTTVRTTLPSKTIQLQTEKNVAERNANILFANVVATSPSMDVAPKHLPLVLEILKNSESSTATGHVNHQKRHLISRLLPKASIKMSIHEPVIRVTLPPMEPAKQGTEEFDLLISAMTSISLDLESSHSAGGDLHYSLSSTFRVSSHQLYYQTASIEKHDLLRTDEFEIKVQLSASPEVAVFVNGNLKTFSVFMVRPEIAEGIRQIVAQLRSQSSPMRRYHRTLAKRQCFLRKLPPWLVHVQLVGSDFSVEVAGIDEKVSKDPKGVALHLGSWNAEYKADREEQLEPRPNRRRATSRSINRDEFLLRPNTPSSPRRKLASATDGRRLALHVQSLEGFVVESADTWEPDPFLNLPKFEVAFSTSSDAQGPKFHINSFAKSLYLHYSLYRHYAIGVAGLVLRKAFTPEPIRMNASPNSPMSPGTPSYLNVPGIHVEDVGEMQDTKPEITTIDFKAAFVQVKATMPADLPLMLQIQDFDAGRHRWQAPFARARLARLYADTPRMRGIWSRVISIKSIRVDFRASRRKTGQVYTDEKSIDIATDAIRLAVPHQLVMHKIFDNFANIIKTVKQLHHRFQTDSDDDVLEKGPEGPKHVPRISLRSQAVLFEIEDGSFEWKLGVIYRLGLLEQKQRMAREEAFRLKVKKLEEAARHRGSHSSRLRTKSAHDGGRAPRKRSTWKHRSKSHDRSETSSPDRHGRRMRYDTDGKADMSAAAHTDVEDARVRLERLNAQSWKKRIDYGLSNQTRAMKDIRSIFWGLDEMPEDANQQKEAIMAIPQRPALMAMLVSDFNFMVDRPSFPLAQYSNFLHRVGKGMPYNQQYSLLIPMSVSVSMGEVRVTLRDYPLPLIHVPAIRAGQSPRLPGLSLKTDFVIAEEYQDSESSRHAHVVVVPPQVDTAGNATGGYAVDVPRTVAPVKTYSDMLFEINSSAPTRITWGTSYQPAIQDMMQVIESFTKPAVDPSERVGFWDKIRLSFHSRISVAWKGDGDVHFIMKGSRDPYMVTGVGAGLVMCWRNNVRWSICQHDDPRKFMMVESGSYVLAIPDLSHYARIIAESMNTETDSISSTSSQYAAAAFKKTIMKLHGKVQWLAGLMFERNLDDGDKQSRSFDFIPHYKVVLKNPKYATCTKDKVYDAFRGFRSHHIHLSIAISAPHDRNWSLTNLDPSPNYNSVHLTPRFFSHFFNWWSMFSGVMALPIRQGKLWPGIEKSSKKFGRHLATIKYSLLLSPLFMSHVYKHKDVGGPDHGAVSATGLKVKLDSFMLDLHQRREEFRTHHQAHKDDGNEKSTTTGMKINRAQLDFIAADIRAISALVCPASATEQVAEDVPSQTDGSNSPIDLSKFTIPDKDLNWIDMDDFVEMDWTGPTESNPRTKILPLAYAPRFTYFRQTDHEGHISGDPHRFSPFGNEPTHYCVMSRANDPRRVQRDLVNDRLKTVQDQLAHNDREVGQQELENVRSVDVTEQKHHKLYLLKQHSDALRRKLDFLRQTRDSLDKKLVRNDERPLTSDSDSDETRIDEFFEAPEELAPQERNAEGVENTPFADYITEFNNRFIVHNVQLKWNNSLRDIIVRYIHQVSQRRGFVYYMSRNAVKFILDIVKEQEKSRHSYEPQPDPRSPTDDGQPCADGTDDAMVQDRIQELVNDAKKFVDADDPEHTEDSNVHHHAANEDIAVEYTAQNSYHVRLVAPQIQLQSEKNKQSAVLVTAKSIQLRVIQIMDRERVADSVSGLVQRRFTATMDSLQMFVTSSKTFSTEYLHMYSGNRYGAPHGKSWPPWVPFEAMFEFDTNPYGFERVVQQTSASLRFDKYNTLRLKHSDDVTGCKDGPDHNENRMDHIWIDFPHFRAICDSTQYYSLYVMALDLLLYNEPLEKTRTERLEKIMLASDFSDLTGAPEMVIMLQDRIRQLEEIKTHFQINEKYLDKQGWKDRTGMEQDLASCEDELFFMMKAITTAQQRVEDKFKSSQAEGVLRWYIGAREIVWHLVQAGSKPLVEFQLKDALFDRTDNNDGSNTNNVEIGQIQGLNLLDDALYPEMISPFIENDKPFADGRDTKMLRVNWHMLEAIGGIPVMSSFEVNLFPLKLQLEKDVGMRLFEYIFPKYGQKGLDSGTASMMVRSMLPSSQEESGDEEEIPRQQSTVPSIEFDHVDDNGSGPLSLEQRLQPTLNLFDPQTRRRSMQNERRSSQLHGLGLFKETFSRSSRSSSVYRNRANDVSTDALPGPIASRPSSHRTPSSMSRTPASTKNSIDEDRPSRFRLIRTTSDKDTDKEKRKAQRSDDLTQMMSRASNYMSYAYVKIPSMVLCLSYKGKGQRNFEDVHDLVFRMPTLEYRNKMWSNLDLALQLKKDVIRALISHAGAIVGNKFSHHRPSKMQQSKLRQIAGSSALMSSSAVHHSLHLRPGSRRGGEDTSMPNSPNPLASSELSQSQWKGKGTGTPSSNDAASLSDADGGDLDHFRTSFTSNRQSTLSSYPSSMHSSQHNLQLSGLTNGSHMDSAHEAANFADELSRVDDMEPETIRRSLTRHLTTLSHKVGSVASAAGNHHPQVSPSSTFGSSHGHGRPKSSAGPGPTREASAYGNASYSSQGGSSNGALSNNMNSTLSFPTSTVGGAGSSGPGTGAGGTVTGNTGQRHDEEEEEGRLVRKGRMLLGVAGQSGLGVGGKVKGLLRGKRDRSPGGREERG